MATQESAKTKIAVIVPSYNRKALLLETVGSIMQQRLRKGWQLEVIVVDDGSTDGTSEVFAGDKWAVESVFYIHQRNSERGAARNRGAHFAIHKRSADWLLFFDSDDVLLEGALDAMIEKLQNHYITPVEEIVAVYANIENWWGGPRKPASIAKGLASSIGRSPEGDVIEYFIDRPLLPLGATLIRASAFTRVGGFSENRAMTGSEDFHFLFRIAMQGPILHADYVAVLYRQHASNTHPAHYIISTDLAIAELRGEIFAKWPGEKANGMYLRLCIRGKLCQAGALSSRGYLHEASRILLQTIQTYPKVLFKTRLARIWASLAKQMIIAPRSSRN